MHKSIHNIAQLIQKHEQNSDMVVRGYQPIFSAHPAATVVIIGQAPGVRAQESGIPWHDKSGEQLRRWLGVSDEIFYDDTKIALMPMDFYFPGKGKTGDLPPRKGFAELWHPQLLSMMPNIKLTLLIGQYAQKHYLIEAPRTLTETVRAYREYLPRTYFPLPHPSPRNNIWKSKHPWFEKEVVPMLKKVVAKSLDRS